MPERTSCVAAATTSRTGRGLPLRPVLAAAAGKMFSTSTTASSTSSPMAMARPPSVMVLIDRPNALNTSTVIRIEIGMAVSEMNVVAHSSQEQEQDDGDDDHRLHQHLFDVADRGLDEVGLPEQDFVGL